MPVSQPYDIAIIGGGFCGTLTALQIVRRSRGRLRIALIEKAPMAGCGLAYGTEDYRHLLNVRAGQMGAMPDAIDGFHRWLLAQPAELAKAGLDYKGPDDFMPRRLYGAYLQHLLAQAQDTITLVRAHIKDVVPHADGYALQSDAADGLRARRVVLATGNFPPGADAANPYDPALWRRLAAPGDVMLVGTGLTTLDLLVTLNATKPSGRIHLLSRSGLFPQTHRLCAAYPPFMSAETLPVTAAALLRRVRREIKDAARRDIPWQAVIDALRPLNQQIWQHLPLAEQQTFLRRIRSYWDTHRHRCAPAIAAVRDRLTAAGRLVVHRGSLIGTATTDGGVTVTWRPRGQQENQALTVHAAALCTGPQVDLRRLDDPLIQNLLRRDLLMPDALRLGAATTATGQLLNAAGQAVSGFYAIGSLRKGTLYESVAVPELRQQAAALAATIMIDVKHQATA